MLEHAQVAAGAKSGKNKVQIIKPTFLYLHGTTAPHAHVPLYRGDLRTAH